MITLKKILFAAIVFLFVFNSCNSPTESGAGGAGIEIPAQKPVITGITITSADSPDEIGYWRNPHGSEPHGSESVCYDIADVPHDGGIAVLPRCMQLESPYPNPTSGAFIIQFSLPIQTEVSLWAVKGRLPEEGEDSFVITSGGAFYSPDENATVILINNATKNAGRYQVVMYDYDKEHKDIPAGFYRIYLKADGHLFWKDVLLARTCADFPADLKKKCRGE